MDAKVGRHSNRRRFQSRPLRAHALWCVGFGSFLEKVSHRDGVDGVDGGVSGGKPDAAAAQGRGPSGRAVGVLVSPRALGTGPLRPLW